MAATVTTQSVEEAVSNYISEQHPFLECLDVAMLKLDETWLVQATVQSSDGSGSAERIVVLVGPDGRVAEAGATVSRQSAQRCLAGLKTTALTEANW